MKQKNQADKRRLEWIYHESENPWEDDAPWEGSEDALLTQEKGSSTPENSVVFLTCRPWTPMTGTQRPGLVNIHGRSVSHPTAATKE